MTKAAPVQVSGVRVTSPDRVVYRIDGAAVTKLDVARYIERAAPLMLPHVCGRPMSIVRAREGSDGPAFFQKHPMRGMPKQIGTVDVMEKSGVNPSLMVTDAAGLVGLVQMSALEFHTWGSRDGDSETPDRVVIDLDPDEALPWARVVDAAVHARAVLRARGIEGFVKTTGGKGLHVVAPIDGSTWHEAFAFSELVAMTMERERPDAYVLNMKKALRAGKIFLDFGRNMRGATTVAAWSTRVKGGRIAAPLAWEELAVPPRFTLLDFAERAGLDPWRGFFDARQRIRG